MPLFLESGNDITTKQQIRRHVDLEDSEMDEALELNSVEINI
jgi:hypothetical protein